jgi:hypothetical protein
VKTFEERPPQASKSFTNQGKARMSAIATRDSVSSATSETTWLCPSDLEMVPQHAPGPQRRRGFVWGLLFVCAISVVFAGVSKVGEESLSHYNLPGISAPK